jgi:hypothetical protein
MLIVFEAPDTRSKLLSSKLPRLAGIRGEKARLAALMPPNLRKSRRVKLDFMRAILPEKDNG